MRTRAVWRHFPGLVVWQLLLLLALSLPGRATIQYSVVLDHPEKHLFHVTMTIPDVNREIVVRIPAWNACFPQSGHDSFLRALPSW